MRCVPCEVVSLMSLVESVSHLLGEVIGWVVIVHSTSMYIEC